jgi:lipopolysaccharide export system permease protein
VIGSRLLDRYVAIEFLRLFILFLLAMPFFICFMELVERLDRYQEIARQTSVTNVALGLLYQMPTYMLWAFPVASLIATIFTVNNLTRHSEVTAAKTGGISFYRMFAILGILGVLLTGAALALAEIAPVANRMRAEILGEKASGRSSRADFLYRARDGRVFSIHRLDVSSGHIRQISIERPPTDAGSPGMHTLAQEALYDRSQGWTLHGGYLRVFPQPGQELAFRFERMWPAGFTETPDQLLAEPKDPDEMRYRELADFIDVVERSGGRPLKLMVEKAQKIAIPIATLIIILFAAPLASSSPRGGPAYGIGISLGITIVYLMLFKIAGAAGAGGALPPVTAAWLPNAVFALAALALLTRVRT